MPDIRHRVAISAPLPAVYQAVATPEGISQWWTRDGVKGTSNEGSRLQISFGHPEPAAVMEITQLTPDQQVSWKCVEGPAEWVGTTITFGLTQSDNETVVMFSHDGWREPVDFMAHCSARWAYFLFSLKSLTENGAGTPFPEDMKF